MPDANGYISGKEGYCLVAGVAYPFGEWDLDMGDSGTPELTNFNTVPFPYFVAGIHKARLRLSGPYQALHMPIANLNSYVFTLGFYPGVYLQGTFLVKLKISNKVEDAPRVEVTGVPIGAFGISLV